MLQVILIGNLGADAEKKNEQGRLFTTFRVAHTDRWTDANGQQHTQTTWVDCVLNEHPKVADFLKQGQMVAVMGSVRLRVYSSAKERCMKAGLTVAVRTVELLGSVSDDVPRRLYDTNGVQHDVNKAYYVTDIVSATLMDLRGNRFVVDENRWVARVHDTQDAAAGQNAAADSNNSTGPDASADANPANDAASSEPEIF